MVEHSLINCCQIQTNKYTFFWWLSNLYSACRSIPYIYNSLYSIFFLLSDYHQKLDSERKLTRNKHPKSPQKVGRNTTGKPLDHQETPRRATKKPESQEHPLGGKVSQRARKRHQQHRYQMFMFVAEFCRLYRHWKIRNKFETMSFKIRSKVVKSAYNYAIKNH